VLAYLGIGYCSWILALLVLKLHDRPLAGSGVIAAPLLASFIMLAWDLSLEPQWATVDRAWIWHDGGAFFGVPISNFMGWYLTANLFFQLFALEEKARRARRSSAALAAADCDVRDLRSWKSLGSTAEHDPGDCGGHNRADLANGGHSRRLLYDVRTGAVAVCRAGVAALFWPTSLRSAWGRLDTLKLGYPAVAFLAQFRAAPNLLTMVRLFTIPFIVIEILDGNFGVAFSLFILAGISDGFDGLLARWLNQKTTLGLYLDPIADKLLLSTLFLVLTHVGIIPRYVTVLVFSRDFGILLIATLLFATHTLRDFRPSFFGKLNTLVQIVALLTILGERAFSSHQFALLNVVLVRSIAFLAPLSAAQYAWIVIQRIHSAEERARKAATAKVEAADSKVGVDFVPNPGRSHGLSKAEALSEADDPSGSTDRVAS
jgi:cardiolipin synthase